MAAAADGAHALPGLVRGIDIKTFVKDGDANERKNSVLLLTRASAGTRAEAASLRDEIVRAPELRDALAALPEHMSFRALQTELYDHTGWVLAGWAGGWWGGAGGGLLARRHVRDAWLAGHHRSDPLPAPHAPSQPIPCSPKAANKHAGFLVLSISSNKRPVDEHDIGDVLFAITIAHARHTASAHTNMRANNTLEEGLAEDVRVGTGPTKVGLCFLACLVWSAGGQGQRAGRVLAAAAGRCWQLLLLGPAAACGSPPYINLPYIYYAACWLPASQPARHRERAARRFTP